MNADLFKFEADVIIVFHYSVKRSTTADEENKSQLNKFLPICNDG